MFYKKHEKIDDHIDYINLFNFISFFQQWLDKHYNYTHLAGTIYCDVVISDSGTVDSPSANHHRGYHDYNRSITINPNAADDHTKIFYKFICDYLKKGNLWFKDHSILNSTNWYFNYGYDSGD